MRKLHTPTASSLHSLQQEKARVQQQTPSAKTRKYHDSYYNTEFRSICLNTGHRKQTENQFCIKEMLKMKVLPKRYLKK